MSAESHKTTDHEAIKKWAEERKGVPSLVKGTKSKGSGVLRIDFPGGAGTEALDHISWEKFFEIFDERKLTFLYQEKTADGNLSRFNKFVYNEK